MKPRAQLYPLWFELTPFPPLSDNEKSPVLPPRNHPISTKGIFYVSRSRPKFFRNLWHFRCVFPNPPPKKKGVLCRRTVRFSSVKIKILHDKIFIAQQNAEETWRRQMQTNHLGPDQFKNFLNDLFFCHLFIVYGFYSKIFLIFFFVRKIRMAKS